MVSSAFDLLSGRRVLLFGGKGGVGKTTVSCLAALHYARSGRVVLFSTDPASNLADIFSEQRPANLVIEAVDAAALYQRWLGEHLDNLLEVGDRGTYLDRDELRRFFELSIPGIDELMAWMRIAQIAESEPDAMVVVDTAPTGHTLRMLGAAEHFREFAVALDALEAKHRAMVRQFTRRNVRDAIDEWIEKFDADARRRRELLTDPGVAAFIPVFLSEPWVVEQTMRLIEEVRSDGMDVPLAILNRAIVEADCERDRQRQKGDAEARARLAPLRVFDLPRACFPLDSVEALDHVIPSGARDLGGGWRRDGDNELRTAGPPRSLAHARDDMRLVVARKTRLLFLAGKGGVGKTTCAASIALQFAGANRGKRFTIVSVDPAHAVLDVFRSDAPPANLSVETIDTRVKWQTFRENLGVEVERAVNALTPGRLSVAYDADAIRKLLDIAPPGADELFAISRLAELLADETQELIVVDTAPTGHFLRLLELPRTAGEWVREFMRILLRYRELVPAGSLGEELVSASRAFHSLEAALRSEQSDVVVVTRPERIVAAETIRLRDELQRRGIRCTAVIVNYVTPDSDCPCDRELRAHEAAVIEPFGVATLIERRDAPVTGLLPLARLVPLSQTQRA